MFLGIEIGGTKLQLGLGTGNGILQGQWRARVEPSAGGEGIRRQILEGVPALLHSTGVPVGQVRAVGIGFGGPVDDAARRVIKSHHLAGWDDFPLAEWVENLLHLPARLGNDADVAGLGEALFGAGRGFDPVFYATIGSGIGGGFICNRSIYRGTGKGAAELGHLRIYGQEILEDHASGWGMEKKYRARSGHAISARDLAQRATQGEPLALEVLAEAHEAFSLALCHVIALLCPRRIILGGGVSLMGETLWFEPIRRKVAEKVFAPFAAEFDLVPAQLGEEVVLHGAIGLAALS